ncbi:MAG: T9SS type A sorting domain-containing protein [Candidatus Kapabacteria bacterium]|jgi:hypothetical protein|nr:T9SS type A sorting domain-containing protein [Candidatus Kapabacteria bacterium]
MKNFYLAVVLAILLPIGIFSKTANYPEQVVSVENPFMKLKDIGIKPSDINEYSKDDFPSPQLAFQVLDVDTEFFWTAMFDGVTPFAYEPKSNTLVYVTTKRSSDGTWSNASVFLHFSNDGGQTWTAQEVYSEERIMFFFPSVAVLNPTNSNNPEEFKYVITVTPFIPRPTPVDTLYYGEGHQYLYFNGQGWEEVDYLKENAPSGNNLGGNQEWAISGKKMFASSSEKGDFFYVYGMLQPKDEGIQYGAYGLAIIDFSDVGANPKSLIPHAWRLDIFRDPGALTQTSNAPMNIHADENGDLYSFVYNMFRDDSEKRVFAFSKSTDNGLTWTDFNRIPYERITDYLQAWNHNMTLNHIPYPFTDWGAVVTGVDEFSLFQRFYTFEGTQTNPMGNGHILEFQYKGGAWQPAVKVGEMTWFDDSRYQNPIRIANALGNDGFKDSVYNDYRYQQLQAALTADRDAIVVKWVDFDDDYLAVLLTPINLVGNPMTTVESLYSADIMIAHKPVNSGNWESYNITQDVWYNKGTYIPDMVPSLTQIPVVEYITQELTNTQNVRFHYPYYLQNIVADRSWSGAQPNGLLYTVAVANFDALNPAPVRNPTLQRPKGTVGSVTENLPFALEEISPNPASESTVLNFNLEIEANVLINIQNAMGQVLKTIKVDNANIGFNTVNVNVSDLPSGAYFYTVNVNGKTQTKLLNVVR